VLRFGSPIRVAPGLLQFRAVASRVTVVTAGESALVIDAGAKGSVGIVLWGLEALGIKPEQVAVIAITHHHPDHIGGLARLSRATGARVAAHKLDAGVIAGSEPRPDPYRNEFVAGVTRPIVRALYGDGVEVDTPLKDGDVLPFEEEEVRAVHTPGHTPGSTCYYIPEKGAVIVGDALQRRSGKLGPPAENVTADNRLARESLAKLLPLDFHTICFSHYPPLTTNAHRELEMLVESMPAADSP
jgi:glyoxylase-like metal-dependent hydrolase (beta-lactamase superfamily II)